MGTAGLAATFLPHELLRHAGTTPTPALALMVQAYGALLFAFAMVNWTARGSLIGGIYNRPIAIGNLTHFVMAALAASKAAVGSHGLWPVAVVYALFAAAFTWVFFRSPVTSSSSSSRS